MTQRDPAKQFAKQLDDLRREIRSGSRGSQMRFRALQGGAIPVYDANGKPTGSIGVLPDGTTGFQVVSGPKPVAPSAPILFPLVGGLEVQWDGATFDGSPLPGDFRALEIHASPFSVYTPDATTLRANVIRPGTILLTLPEGAWTVVFRIRTTADVVSEPSVSATETAIHAPSAQEITDARSAAQAAQDAANTANAKALEAAGIAAGKGKVYTQTAAPAADVNSLWIDTTGGANTPKRWNGTGWVAVTDAGIKAAADAAAAASTAAAGALTAAQTASKKADDAMTAANTAATSANGKNRNFYRPSTSPPPAPLIEGDLWFKTDQGNQPWKYDGASASWVLATFGDQALAGLNVGKLTSGSIAVGQKIVAGLSTGTHAEMSDDGFRVFLMDPLDGIPDEVVRMGTKTDDLIGVADRNGRLLASIDSTGVISGQGLNINGPARFNGREIGDLLGSTTAGTVLGQYRGLYGYNVDPIATEVGIVEVNAFLTAGRAYEINWQMTWVSTDFPTEAIVRVRSTPPAAEGSDQATGAPLITSFEEEVWNRPQSAATYWNTDNGVTTIYPSRNGRHRFLLTIARGAGTGTLSVRGDKRIILSVKDAGVKPAQSGNASGGGGQLYVPPTSPPPPPPAAPPPPTQQYFVDLAPSGFNTYNGAGVLRGDAGGQVIQGYDPSGYNGDGYGFWTFPLPNITGTVDRVDLYLYSSHWYFNSGGTGILNIIKAGQAAGGLAQFNTLKLAAGGDWYVPGFQKPGGMTVTVPADWWSGFRTAQGASRAIGISVGGSGNTNLTYYGRFDGPAARLRIWYTQ